MDEPAPFTCKTALIIEGGYLQKPWAASITSVGGRSFIALLKQDKDLVKALGISGRSPYLASLNAFEYIARVRNKIVDDMILSHSSSSDPMADKDGPPMQIVSSRDRSKAYGVAGVSNIVQVTLDGFTTEEGKIVSPIQANILSTATKNVNPCVECTPEVLDWLVHAVFMDWAELCPDLFQAPKVKRTLPEWLPELSPPLSYSTAGGKIAVVVGYKNERGVWTRKRRAVEDILGADEEVNTTIIKNVASALQKFYEENHHQHGAQDSAQDAATPLATDD